MVEPTAGPASSRDVLLIAGGGTGGHLFPGVAVAEAWIERGGRVWFVGTARGIEARVIPGLGHPLELIDVVGIKGRGLGARLAALLRLPRAFVQSWRLLGRVRPGVVLGVGGYASGPVVIAAWLRRIPTAILEQNSLAGLTNRLLGRVVQRVFTTFPDPRGQFPRRSVEQLGNPIRRAIRARLGAARPGAQAGPRALRAAGPARLLVFGGSQGARGLNDAFLAALDALLARVPDLQILHQVGQAELARVSERYRARGLVEPQARIVAFIDDMAEAYAWADLALCRAGATSLAELAVVGLPAVLVPLPTAADDHQTHNARALVDAGAALMVPQADCAGGQLAEVLVALIEAPDRLEGLSRAMRGCARPGAAEAVAERLSALAEAGRRASASTARPVSAVTL